MKSIQVKPSVLQIMNAIVSIKRGVIYLSFFALCPGIYLASPLVAQQQIWNLAVGTSVDASGYAAGFPPENAITANSPLCWVVEGGGHQWFEIYFDAPVFIERFELTIGHPYEGEPILVFGRNADGNYSLLHRFENEDLDGDTLLALNLSQTWENIEFIRMELPESPLYLCWRDLGLIGYIPGRIPPEDNFPCEMAPDRIYYNGTVITMDPSLPFAEAIAIRNGKITGVGTNEEVFDTRIAGCESPLIDLEGLTVLPGFNDAHCHIFSWPQEICHAAGDTSYPSLEDRTSLVSQSGWTSLSELAFGRPDDGSREHMENAIDLDVRGLLPFRLNGYWGSILDLGGFDVLSDSGLYPGRRFTGRVRAPGVKLYIDHPLGIDDGPYTQEEVNQLVARARQDGWQIAAHAVNTNGVEKILTAYELALGVGTNENDRYRIEHAVKVSDNQLMRMRDKSIIASFQLIGPPDWPEQQTHQDYISNTNPEWQMRWREFVDSGVPSVGSTDYPFNDAPCDYSPFRAVYQGVTRIGYIERDHADWELNQRLTVVQCLKLLTIDGAYATKEDHLKGSLTAGKWADLVVVSENPLEITNMEDLLNIEVLLTLVGGRVEYCNSSAVNLCEAYETFNINSALITASGYLPGQTPDMVYDGDPETGWGSGDYAPQWIRIDLQDSYKINGVDLIVDQYPAGNTVHQLLGRPETSTTGFQLLHEFTGYTDYGQTLRYIAPVDLDSLRYIKVLTTESPSWVAWKEIIIYKNTDFPSGAETNHSFPEITAYVAPMPLTSGSRLYYRLPYAARVSIYIYTTGGKILDNWMTGMHEPGLHSISLEPLTRMNIPKSMLLLRIETENRIHILKIPDM